MISNVFGNLHPIAFFIILLILVIFLGAVIITLLIKSKYSEIASDLENGQFEEGASFKASILNSITEEYKISASKHNEVNTQAIIENTFNNQMPMLNLGERFGKHAVSLIIILGLLGTFFGLTISIERLVELLSVSGDVEVMESMGSIIEGLVSSVRGMSVAFVTSLFGIACAVFLTVINIVFNVEDERISLMTGIEEYLDNTVAPVYAKAKEDEHVKMQKVLTQAVENVGQTIEKSMDKTVGNLENSLVKSIIDVQHASNALGETIQKFDESLQTFRDNTRDFSEFNFNLRHNIERMDISFVDLRETLKETAKIIEENQKSMKKDS